MRTAACPAKNSDRQMGQLEGPEAVALPERQSRTLRADRRLVQVKRRLFIWHVRLGVGRGAFHLGMRLFQVLYQIGRRTRLVPAVEEHAHGTVVLMMAPLDRMMLQRMIVEAMRLHKSLAVWTSYKQPNGAGCQISPKGRC